MKSIGFGVSDILLSGTTSREFPMNKFEFLTFSMTGNKRAVECGFRVAFSQMFIGMMYKIMGKLDLSEAQFQIALGVERNPRILLETAKVYIKKSIVRICTCSLPDDAANAKILLEELQEKNPNYRGLYSAFAGTHQSL